MRYAIYMLLLTPILSGCGKAEAVKTKTLVPIEQVPAVVLDAARKKEPEVTFNKVIKTPEGIYEVQGKNKSGKVVEVETSEKGEVLKVE